MARINVRVVLLVLAGAGTFAAAIAADVAQESKEQAPVYETRAVHDPDGIGKFYFGREIAHVMGHQAADWLERPEREAEEKPDAMVAAIPFKRGDRVADIGAGTGYISRRIAQKVGLNGIVYAVDIQPEMLDLMRRKMVETGITNIVPVLGEVADPKLKAGSVDWVIMVDVYHELSEPAEMLDAIVRSLSPEGRVVFVEYRAEDPEVPIKRLHKMSERQVRKEAEAHALVWEKTISTLPRQHILVFQKRR